MNINLYKALDTEYIHNATNAVYNGRPVRFFSNLDRDTFSLYEDKDVVLSSGTCNKYQFDTETRVISLKTSAPTCICESQDKDYIRLSCLQHSFSGPFDLTVGGKLEKVTVRFYGDKTMSIVHGALCLLLNENRKDWLVQNGLLTYDPSNQMIEDYDGVTVGDMADWLKDNGFSCDSKMRAVVVNSDTGVISNGIVVSVEEVQ